MSDEELGFVVELWSDRIRMKSQSPYFERPRREVYAEISDEKRAKIQEELEEVIEENIDKDDWKIRDNAKTNTKGEPQSRTTTQ